MAYKRILKLNAFNKDFKLNLILKCISIKQAVEIRNLLKENKFDIEVERYNFSDPKILVERIESRCQEIKNYLKQKNPRSITKCWRHMRKSGFHISPASFSKDVSLLIFKNEIVLFESDNKAMLKLNEWVI